MIITKEEAKVIAREAMNLRTFHVTDYTGYWQICESGDYYWMVAVNKEQDENGGDQHFAAYFVAEDGENFWEYTDTLDGNELADLITRTAKLCFDNLPKGGGTI